jgi:hypothetical protein
MVTTDGATLASRPNWPAILTEASLPGIAPVQAAGTFILDDVVNGVLDTSILGASQSWSDLSAWVRSGSVNRPGSRQKGPLWSSQPGTASVALKNGDGRFDPDNLAGPYATPAIPPMRFGAWLSAGQLGAADWNGAYANWQALGGPSLGAVRWYGGTTYSAGTTITQAVAAGMKVCLDLAPPYNPVSSADYVAIQAYMQALQAMGASVEVSLWHEPGLNGLTSVQYAQMMQYYGPAIRPYYRLWCVFSGSDAIESNGYYPGDGHVDGIAADCYGTSHANLDSCRDMADNHGLPVGLWEFGTALDFGMDPSPVTGTTVAAQEAFLAYVTSFFVSRVANGQPVGDLLFFSDTGSTTGTAAQATGLSAEGGFEGAPGNWVAGSTCTVAQTTAQAHSGTGSLALTCTTPGTIGASSCATASVTTQGTPVTSLQSVGFSCWFRPGSSTRSVQAGVSFYNSSGTFISNAFAVAVTETASAWTFSGGTAQAPAGAAWFKASPQVASAANGEVHYIDDPQWGVLPPGTDHTAPVQYSWDYRLPYLAAMQQALDGRGALAAVSGLVPMVPVRVRAQWAGVTYPLFSGFADSWVPEDGRNYGGRYAEAQLSATDGQAALAAITLPATGAAGAGEASGARVSRVLDSAGWYTGTGQRHVAAGDSTLQSTTYGDTAWNLMQAAADAEIGDLYIDGSGALVFRNRHAILTEARSSTPQAVFGDSIGTVETAGTEQAYYQVTRARDLATMANDVQATRVGGSLQHVQDAASIATYLFPRSYARSDLILQDDVSALAWAQWVLYVAASDEDRFDQLVLYPLRDPASLWPQVLGREVGDRIQVWRRPPGVASPVVKDCFIRGIQHSWGWGNGQWATTWTLQDAGKYGSFLTLDSPTLGALGFNALAFLGDALGHAAAHPAGDKALGARAAPARAGGTPGRRRPAPAPGAGLRPGGPRDRRRGAGHDHPGRALAPARRPHRPARPRHSRPDGVDVRGAAGLAAARRPVAMGPRPGDPRREGRRHPGPRRAAVVQGSAGPQLGRVDARGVPVPHRELRERGLIRVSASLVRGPGAQCLRREHVVRAAGDMEAG